MQWPPELPSVSEVRKRRGLLLIAGLSFLLMVFGIWRVAPHLTFPDETGTSVLVFKHIVRNNSDSVLLSEKIKFGRVRQFVFFICPQTVV
jgi:hypothetical protein